MRELVSDMAIPQLYSAVVIIVQSSVVDESPAACTNTAAPDEENCGVDPAHALAWVVPQHACSAEGVRAEPLVSNDCAQNS